MIRKAIRSAGAACAALLCVGCQPQTAPEPREEAPPPASEQTRETVEPLPQSSAPAPDLPHAPPGELLPASATNFGSIGVTDGAVVAPFMRFPLESGPAFANSQIFNPGGGGYAYKKVGGPLTNYPGPGGSENTASNFAYPWRDNFCEVRTWTNALCASGDGHLGQDVRPATCEREEYWIVAPERSEVKRIGDTFEVQLYGLETGIVYALQHMDSANGILPRIRQARADKSIVIERGERIAKVSNILGATARTTTHLHIEIWEGGFRDGANKGVRPMPPYTSLVESYLDLVAENPEQVFPVEQPAQGPGACAPRP
jgi:hypothetical protein